MNKIAIAISAFAVMALPAGANAAACRDAHGHFIKCATAPAATPAAHPTPHATASHAAAPASSPGRRCRNAKGQYAKCGTPGAKPA